MAFSEKLKGMLVSLQPPGDITAFTELFKSDTLDVGTASSVKKKHTPSGPLIFTYYCAFNISHDAPRLWSVQIELLTNKRRRSFWDRTAETYSLSFCKIVVNTDTAVHIFWDTAMLNMCRLPLYLCAASCWWHPGIQKACTLGYIQGTWFLLSSPRGKSPDTWQKVPWLETRIDLRSTTSELRCSAELSSVIAGRICQRW